MPLHTVNLESELVSGRVAVGMRPRFPINGVSLILGNDLAGGKVLVTPEVTPVPVLQCPDKLAEQHPEGFASCAVTHVMARNQATFDDEIDLSECFLVDQDGGSCVAQGVSASQVGEISETKPVSLSRDQLVAEQKCDADLSALIDSAVSEVEMDSLLKGYVLRDNLLMRIWSPLNASGQDDWSVVKQIVVPHRYRDEILTLAHDNPLAGHLGVNKTYDRILRHFFWPGLKRDVV